MTLIRYLLLSVLCLGTAIATAKPAPEAVKRTLQSLNMQGAPIEWIKDLRMFEVTTGRGALYISESGKHFVLGDWYSVTAGAPVNQTQARKAMIANTTIASSFPEKDMVSFAVKNPKETLYVFTDPNCGFCRKLHQEIPALNTAGVNVYYIPFPVISEESRQDSINIWCAKNQRVAMTRAKAGKTNPKADCDNVSSIMDAGLSLGRRLGVNGTPYIIAKKANMVFAGFVPAQSLLKHLGIK